MPLEKAITIKEAAEALGISPNHLYRLTGENKVPFFRVGGVIRFLLLTA